MGPVTYAQHLLSAARLPFTAAYFGSIALTLYFSLGVRVSLSSRTLSAAPILHNPTHDGLDHLFTDPHAARIQDSHVDRISLSVGLLVMVPRQLFPYGIERSPTCNHFRRSEGSSVDDRLKIEGVLTNVNLIDRGASYTKIDSSVISQISTTFFTPQIGCSCNIM